MIFCTSASLRNDDAFAQKPLQPESGVFCGGGGDVPALLPELLPPLQPVRTATAARTSQSSLVFRIAPSPQARTGLHALFRRRVPQRAADAMSGLFNQARRKLAASDPHAMPRHHSATAWRWNPW